MNERIASTIQKQLQEDLDDGYATNCSMCNRITYAPDCFVCSSCNPSNIMNEEVDGEAFDDIISGKFVPDDSRIPNTICNIPHCNEIRYRDSMPFCKKHSTTENTTRYVRGEFKAMVEEMSNDKSSVSRPNANTSDEPLTLNAEESQLRISNTICYHKTLILKKHVPYWSLYHCDECEKPIVIQSKEVFGN